MDLHRAPLRAFGRAALASVFIKSGADILFNPAHRVKQAADFGIKEAELAVRADGLGMVVAGLALAIGYRPKAAAAVLAGLLVPTTLAGHPFWKMDDPQVRHQQEVQFFKNLSMFGGILMVLAERPKPRR